MLYEYTENRAQLLYNLNIPEINSPFNMKIRRIDILFSKDMGSNVNADTHAHTCYELQFVLSGEITYSIDGIQSRLTAGEGLFISPKDRHKILSSSEDIQKFALAFSVDSTAPVSLNLEDLGNEKFAFSSEVEKNIDFILSHTERDDIFSPLMISARCAEIVYEALFSLGVNSDNLTQEGVDSRFLRARELIDNSPSLDLKCDDVARECYLSTKQLGRIFKQYTGLSLYEYIAAAKITRAKELLSTRKKSIKEIAYLLGFDSESSFNSFFKRRVGITPGAYRTSGKAPLGTAK